MAASSSVWSPPPAMCASPPGVPCLSVSRRKIHSSRKRKEHVMRKLVLSALLVTLLVACSSEPPKPAAPVEELTPGAVPPPSATTTPALPPGAGAISPLRDPNNILYKRSVYFDYDSFVVKDEYKSLVTAHSRYLGDNRSTRIVIQGNADERGSSEYNLALGQKRADAV